MPPIPSRNAKPAKFSETRLMADLIETDYDILPVLSRFSIPLGFGSRTVREVCESNGIDCNVFLLVVNLLLTGEIDAARMTKADAMAVVRFLHKSHDFYLNYKYPHIRHNLLEALDPSHSDINQMIVKYFDDYVEGVRKHFDNEEEKLFPYVKSLSEGHRQEGYTAESFIRQHDHEVEAKLGELKNIIMRYYTTSMPFRMYDVLVDIFNCEADLREHSDVEENILVPLLRRLEKFN